MERVDVLQVPVPQRDAMRVVRRRRRRAVERAARAIALGRQRHVLDVFPRPLHPARDEVIPLQAPKLAQHLGKDLADLVAAHDAQEFRGFRRRHLPDVVDEAVVGRVAGADGAADERHLLERVVQQRVDDLVVLGRVEVLERERLERDLVALGEGAAKVRVDGGGGLARRAHARVEVQLEVA